MTTTSLLEVVQLLEDHAPKLRAAGVRSLAVGDVHVELLPAEPELEDDRGDTDEDQDEDSDALNSPATYGLKPGARVPGFPNARRRGASEDDDQ